jgi:translocation and assembly module TamB
MNRFVQIAWIAAGAVLGFAAAFLVTFLLIVHTSWFQLKVRQQVIRSTEQATGGRAQAQGFAFHWSRLQATIHNFTIHGTEPEGAAPLFHAKTIVIGFRLKSPFRGFMDISSLVVDTPEIHVLIDSHGHTNLPTPEVRSKTGVLQTVVDLSIGRFEILHGSLIVTGRRMNFRVRAANLRAHLIYQRANAGYSGRIEAVPLMLQSGARPPLQASFVLPLTIRKDLIAVSRAQFTTPRSHIAMDARVEHMASPRGNAHVTGRINLRELKQALGLEIPLEIKRAPEVVQANLTLVLRNGAIGFENSHLVFGNSTVDLTGMLQERAGGPVEFRAKLDLLQLGRLFRLREEPAGVLYLSGDFALRPSGYELHAAIEGKNFSITVWNRRIQRIDFVGHVSAVPNQIKLARLRLDALGGFWTGSAVIERLRWFVVQGALHDLDLDRLTQLFLRLHTGYSALLSGPIRMQGDRKQPADFQAQAKLAAKPGRSGVPVSGWLEVSYNARLGAARISPSWFALPHSTVTLAGVWGRKVHIQLTSRDLGDLRPVTTLPVELHGGVLNLDATAAGSWKNLQISGRLALTGFSVNQRRFTSFGAVFDASPSRVSLRDATLVGGMFRARFQATAGLRHWKLQPEGALRIDAAVEDGDLAGLLALVGQETFPATGAVTGNAHLSGTVGNPAGDLDFTVTHGSLGGVPFETVSARVVLTSQQIRVPGFEYVAGSSRMEGNGSYRYNPNHGTEGAFQVQVRGEEVQLAPLQRIWPNLPAAAGVANFQGTAAGLLQISQKGLTARWTSLDGRVVVRGLMIRGRGFGNVTAVAHTLGPAVRYEVTSELAGSHLRIRGNTLLAGQHDTAAAATIQNLPMESVLALAGKGDLPLTGSLSGSVQVSGTTAEPHVRADFIVENGSAWGEPFRRLQGALSYANQSLQVTDVRIEREGMFLEASGLFTHPAGDYRQGRLQFQVRSNSIPLARIQVLQRVQPMAGTAALSAAGTAALSAGKALAFSTLNVDLQADGLTLNSAPLGNLTVHAKTQGAQLLVELSSNLAGSIARGQATIQMSSGYPIQARLMFAGLTYPTLAPLLGAHDEPFAASASGTLTLAGPLARPGALQGTLEVTRLEAHPASGVATAHLPATMLSVENRGVIRITLANSSIRVENFRLAGPAAEFTVAGMASLAARKPLALQVIGRLNLEPLKVFYPALFSSGNVSVQAAVRGTLSHPQLAGALQLRDVSLNVESWPNGISNANGTIVFTEREAIVQDVTGQSGGGKVVLSGTVGYGGPETVLRLEAIGEKVFLNYPENVTTEVDAKLQWTGTTTRSVLAGTVTVLDVALHSQTDFGSILSLAAAPKPASLPETGIFGGMHFDIQVESAGGALFRTSVTQNLQADVNLTLRGTPDSPGMLGRMVFTEGEIVFFGNKYTIEQGTVSFYDPQKINPYVNIDLDTRVSGVEVTLSVSGPMDRLKLAYRSDPPLAFTDLLALLTSGTVTVTDPVLAARQPVSQLQAFQQAGASALLSQAVGSPVAGTLQRLFGVTRLQINPRFVSGYGYGYATPQATVSLQQQITPDLVFSYIQSVGQSNPQVIKVEWTIDPQWSAVAQRDYNGFFYLDFYYKKRFW